MTLRSRFEPGDRIHDFVVSHQVGGGTFGTVYACRWDLDDRMYAIKVVDGSFEEARREYLALQTVRHRNIVGCLHAGTIEGGGWYIQCELVEGEALAAFVRVGRRLPVPDAVRIGAEILEGLAAIHPDVERIEHLRSEPELTAEEFDELERLESGGIVHRDIKPENVIQASDGRIVIVDFGIASPSGSRIETQSATPGYLPPDFTYMSGDRWRPDVDLYATGVVIYELICGQHPYEGGEFGSGPKHPPQDVPPRVTEWLLRACATSRADRFPFALAMRDALLRSVQPDGQDETVDESGPGANGRQPSALEIEPYDAWTQRPIRAETDAELEEVILEVVATEEPIVCARLYALIADAMGRTEPAVRSRLNRVVYRMVRNATINQVEPLGQGQIDKTVYLTAIDRARHLGPRTPWEYPKAEVLALVRRIVALAEDEEELVTDLLHEPWLLASILNDALGTDPDSWEARYFEDRVVEAQAVLLEEMSRVVDAPAPLARGEELPEIIVRLDALVARIHRRRADPSIPAPFVIPAQDVQSLFEEAWDLLADWSTGASEEQLETLAELDDSDPESVDEAFRDPAAALRELALVRRHLWIALG